MQESMSLMFANRDDEDAIYPLTTREIAEVPDLNAAADKHGYTKQLVENTEILCKGGNLVIPKSLQHRAVAWYHHYLLHPGPSVSKKQSVSRWIEKVYERQSNHMSKNVIVVR